MKYDFLIVGSGLFGATFAHEVKKAGKSVLVIDKRMHTGGNIHCDNVNGINVHKYGPHIFHTNDKNIWEFVNSHVDFNRFTYSPLACYKGTYYNLPFNMNTFNQIWGVKTPLEAQQIIANQISEFKFEKPQNLEEQAISLVGPDVYEKLIKGYTEKQWGRSARDLPAFIIKRLPVRFTYDNNYFNDRYQGIPIGGYNKITESLLKNIEVKLGVDFLANKAYWEGIAEKIVYTGPIDEFFGYSSGILEYRTLSFETKHLDTENFQGVATVNFTDIDIPYTRIVEHKHFEEVKSNNTVITYEFPGTWEKGGEPYYPVNDEKNDRMHNIYKVKSKELKNYIFGGRLADYKYYDMHQVIASALSRSKSILTK